MKNKNNNIFDSEALSEALERFKDKINSDILISQLPEIKPSFTSQYTSDQIITDNNGLTYKNAPYTPVFHYGEYDLRADKTIGEYKVVVVRDNKSEPDTRIYVGGLEKEEKDLTTEQYLFYIKTKKFFGDK